MKKAYIFIFILLGAITQAQEIKKSSEDNDLRLSSLPYYSFGKGVGITSSDSLFKLNIRFRMQNRLTISKKEGEKESYDAHIRRLRLRFDGFVGNPKFLYAVQLSFAPGDVGKIESGKNLNIIRDAVLIYRPNNNWSFIFGQTKLPGNRQRNNSSGALQLTDRSINNARFNIDRDFGIQANYSQVDKNKFSYDLKTAISTGKGRNWTSASSNSYAATAKVELLPFGTFTKNGVYFEGDITRETTPKLSISGVFHRNKNASLSQGQTGNPLDKEKTFNAVLLDGIFKYDGWSAMIAYMNRMTDNPLITNTIDETGKPKLNYVYAGQGLDLQTSYIFPSNYEIIARYSKQNVHKDLYKINVPNTDEFTLGLTKYIWEHAFKIQTELTYDKLHFHNGDSKNNWYLRFQFEIGI